MIDPKKTARRAEMERRGCKDGESLLFESEGRVVNDK